LIQGEQHVAAMAHLALDRAAARGPIGFELTAKAGHLVLAQSIDRKMVAALAIGLDLAFRSAIWSWVSSGILVFCFGRSKRSIESDPAVSLCQRDTI
jgi:hypothetical protein